MARFRARLPWIVAALIAIGATAWLLRPSALEVETTTVAIGTVRDLLVETGRTRVHRHLELAAPVTGRLAEPTLGPGDTVAAGDTVAIVTPAPLDARARSEADALVAQATTRVREAAVQLEQAEIARASAALDRTRAEQLERAGAIPARERERAVELERMRTRDIEVARARVAAARDGVRAARAVLIGAAPGDVTAPVIVRAPIAGTVLRRLADHGRVVAAGTPLVEIGDPSSLEIVIDVLSRDAERLRPGLPVTIRGGGTTAEGRIERIEPAAFTRRSALGVDEQRVSVIARLASSPRGLGDGYEVDATIVVAVFPNVRRLPTAALVPLDDRWGVWTVTGGRARLVAVTLGRRGTDAVEVLDGVTPGTIVVLRPDDRLADGTRVRAAPRTNDR